MISAQEAREQYNARLQEIAVKEMKVIEQRVQNIIAAPISPAECTITFSKILKEIIFKELKDLGYQFNEQSGNINHRGSYEIKIKW